MKEVRCECGHHCCKICKCAEIPDPLRDFELCPCEKCKFSTRDCDPHDYQDPRMAYPDTSKMKFHEWKTRSRP